MKELIDLGVELTVLLAVWFIPGVVVLTIFFSSVVLASVIVERFSERTKDD